MTATICLQGSAYQGIIKAIFNEYHIILTKHTHLYCDIIQQIFTHLGACANSMCQRPLLQSGMWPKVETSFIPSLLLACFNLKITGREMLDHIILQCKGTIDIGHVPGT